MGLGYDVGLLTLFLDDGLDDVVDVVVDVLLDNGTLVDNGALFGCVTLERRLERRQPVGGITDQCIVILVNLPFKQSAVLGFVGVSLADGGDRDDLVGEKC